MTKEEATSADRLDLALILVGGVATLALGTYWLLDRLRSDLLVEEAERARLE